MISMLVFFVVVLQAATLATAAVTLFVFSDDQNGSAEPAFYAKQVSICKTATLLLLGVGWLLGDPYHMGVFPLLYRCVGVFWFLLGIVYFIFVLVNPYARSNKDVLAQLRKFGTGQILYGVLLTVLAWLLWG